MKPLSAPLSAVLAGLLLADAGMAQTGPFAARRADRRAPRRAGDGQARPLPRERQRRATAAPSASPTTTAATRAPTGSPRLLSGRRPRLHLRVPPVGDPEADPLPRRRPGNRTSGSQSETVTCLAPTGDGRIYLCKAGVLYVLSAANQLAPVIDTSTGQPFNQPLQGRLDPRPGTQTLIGVGGPSLTQPLRRVGTGDGAPALTLSPPRQTGRGQRLRGVDLRRSGLAHGLDRLPGGDLLVTLADSYVGNDNLLRIHPAGPSISLYAEPLPALFRAGVWSRSSSVPRSSWTPLRTSPAHLCGRRTRAPGPRSPATCSLPPAPAATP